MSTGRKNSFIDTHIGNMTYYDGVGVYRVCFVCSCLVCIVQGFERYPKRHTSQLINKNDAKKQK